MEVERLIAGIAVFIIFLLIYRKLRRRQERIRGGKHLLSIKLDKIEHLLNYHKYSMSSPCAKEKNVLLKAKSLEEILKEFQFNEKTSIKIKKLAKELRKFATIKLGQMDKETFDRKIDEILVLVDDLRRSL